MRQTSKLLLALAVVALLALPAGQVLAAPQSLQGGMFDVGPADPFSAKCAQERIWSVINQAVINGANCPTTGVGSCSLGKDTTTQACNRGWSSNAANSTFPGYFSHTDNMTQFDLNADNYATYILWDQQKNGGAANEIGYYYITGQCAVGGETHRFQDPNCAGTTTVSCFLPGTATRHGPGLVNTRLGAISNEGGFAPIPVPKIGSISGSTVNLSWDAVSYFGNGDGACAGGGNSETIPVLAGKEYRLSRIIDNNGNGLCEAQLDTATGWTVLTDTQATTFTDTLPAFTGTQDCAQYSLTLVFDGPDNATSGGNLGEIASVYRGSASAGAKINPSASTIINFDVKYVGKNTFRSSWSSGTETGIAAYRLGRATTASGPFTVISGDIPATGDGSFYSYLDKVNRSLGTTFYYQLQVVHTGGTTDPAGVASASLPHGGGAK